MVSIKDYTDMLERMKEAKARRAKIVAECEHRWTNDFEFVYDYQHQTCTVCNHKRMI